MSLRRQTLWATIPVLATSVISIVSVPIYFRVLGEQMYAIWFYLATLTGAFGFMDLGLGVSIGRFVGVALGRSDHDAVSEYWASGNVLTVPVLFFFSLVFVAVGIFFGPEWFNLNEPEAGLFRSSVIWAGLGLFFTYYGAVWQNLCCTFHDFRFYSFYKTASGVCASAGMLIMALLFKNLVVIFLFNFLLSFFLFLIFFTRVEKKHVKINIKKVRLFRLREMGPYIAKTLVSLVSGALLSSLDRLFLGRYASAGDFAAFCVAQNISSRFTGLSVGIMLPVFHNTTRRIGANSTHGAAFVYRQSFDFIFPFFSLAVLGVFIWSRPLVDLWLGQKHGPVVGDVFPWLFLGLAVNAITNISGTQLSALDKVGTATIFQAAGTLVSALFAVAGFFTAGISGAAVGFALSRIVWLAQDAYTRKLLGVPWSNYLHVTWIIARQALFLLALWGLFSSIFQGFLFQVGGAALSAVAAGSLELYLQAKHKPKLH